jgi:ribosomal protein S1
MKENFNVIKKAGDRSKVYCTESYAQEAYDMYMGTPVSSKDLSNGNLGKVVDFNIRTDGEIEAICDNHTSMYFDVGKERKFFELINLETEKFLDWVKSGNHKSFLAENATYIQMQNDKVQKGSLYTAHMTTIKQEFKEQITNPTKAYVAKIIDKNRGGFIVTLQGINAFMPGSLAAANKITNFDEYIDREINVMIEGYMQSSDMFVVSYKKYLDYVLPSILAELEKDQQLTGNITGFNKRLGVFIEIDEMFTGLLHPSEMSPETLALFNMNQIVTGDEMTVWLKDIDDKKLVLSEIDPVLRQKEIHDFRNANEGIKRSGTIISIKPHGALIKLDNDDTIGLLPIREVKKCSKRLVIGETMKVFIKTVDTDTGKIYFTLNE